MIVTIWYDVQSGNHLHEGYDDIKFGICRVVMKETPQSNESRVAKKQDCPNSENIRILTGKNIGDIKNVKIMLLPLGKQLFFKKTGALAMAMLVDAIRH